MEANPVLVAENKIRFRKFIESGQLTILNVGIAEQKGEFTFYINHHTSEWSSFDKETGTRNNTSYHTIKVPCITTHDLFEKFGIPYYLKIDIEGFDFLCVQAIPGGAGEAKPKFVSCEAVQLEWLHILASKGYTKFKIINQVNNFRPLIIKEESNKLFYRILRKKKRWKTRLQNYIPFEHPIGSTGPFGTESKGEWLTNKEAKEVYAAFYNNFNGPALNDISWFDFHATF